MKIWGASDEKLRGLDENLGVFDKIAMGSSRKGGEMKW